MRIVPLEAFVAETLLDGWSLAADVSIYGGKAYFCACGKTHNFSGSSDDVIRELRGMRFVFHCPNRDAYTLVKIKGFFSIRIESQLGAVSAESGATPSSSSESSSDLLLQDTADETTLNSKLLTRPPNAQGAKLPEDNHREQVVPITAQNTSDVGKLDELAMTRASLVLAQQELERMRGINEELKQLKAEKENAGLKREASQNKENADLLKKDTVATQINIKQTRTRAKKTSVAAWPFPDTVKSVPNKKEKKSKSTTVHKTIVISYDEYEELSWSDGWNIDPSKTTLSNKNTGEVLKATDGLGFSEGQGFYLLYNKSRPRKLRIR